VSPLKTGLCVALVQVLLAASVGARFMIDRARYPRAWLATQPYDPNLPIRGRYVRLQGVVNADDSPSRGNWVRVRLEVRGEALFAIPDTKGHQQIRPGCGSNPCWVLIEPLAFFIPEHFEDPSRLPGGRSLWVEASIPPNGPPRPIRLGVKKDADGTIEPIDVR